MSDAAYPNTPGHRGIDTSAMAAEAIAPVTGRLQAAVLDAVRRAGRNGATTNEIAATLGIGRDSIQPRTSELRAKGSIIDSGRRRENANGKQAIVWVVRP